MLLSGVGLAFVGRLDPSLAGTQTLWILVGVVCLIATLAAVRSLERLARYKYTIMLTGLILLVLPAVVGREVNGARLWLRIGPLSFQPVEIAKVLLVLFLAAYLAEFREVLSVSTRKVLGAPSAAARYLGPVILMWAVSLVLLVSEKDLGSSLLFFGVFLVMITVATGRWSYTLRGDGAVHARRHRRLPPLRGTCRSASTYGCTPSPTRPARATSWCNRCSPWPPAD